MGESNPNFTVRLDSELRKEIKCGAKRFGLSEADITRMLIARGVPSLRKNRLILHANAIQKGAA